MSPGRFDFAAHGLPDISAAQRARLVELIALRARWNRTHDLMGPAAAADPWVVDVCDAVAVSTVMDEGLPLVDVGAGGGVPGLMVACLRPALAITLVEPRIKRVAFLRAAKRALALANLRVVRGRWPHAVALDEAVQVVSRAVVSPEAWPGLAVSGGERVQAIIRMLAVDRAPLALPGWRLVETLGYREEAVERTVERWARQRSSSSAEHP